MSLDRYGRSLQHRLLWREPSTVEGLGELMAQWLEGRISYQPAYLSPAPDAETADLVPVLAVANRAGFLTDFSQPGVPLDGGSGQRAAVAGFCSYEVVVALQAATWGTELVLVSFVPGGQSEAAIAVTLNQGREQTWVGTSHGIHAMCDYYSRDVSTAVLEKLITSWQVHLLDPVWGRNDLLWKALNHFAASQAQA